MGKIRKHRKSGMKGKGKAEGDDRDEGGEETTGMGVCAQGGRGEVIQLDCVASYN